MQLEKIQTPEEFLLSPGKLVTDQNLNYFLCSAMKELYLSMMGYKSSLTENIFIGAHPITMDRSNVGNIQTEEYLVCEKTDGIRYFLVILNNGRSFLHGRNLVKSKEDQFKLELQFFVANLKFPSNFNEQASELRVKYLFDGELVLDVYADNSRIKFLIFDTVVMNYNRVFAAEYFERLEASRKFLSFLKMSKRQVKNNQNIKNKYLSFDPELPKIKLSLKDFFLKEHCEFLFNDYFSKLPHKQDGLIFTKNKAPYKPGKNESILKWKEASQQTIDFLLINNQKFNSPKFYEGQFANRVLDLYLIAYNKEFNTQERVLFDFMFVDEERYLFICDEIEKKQKESESAVCGIIAECKFNRNLENEFMKTVYYSNPAKFSDNLLKSGIFRQGNNPKYTQTFEENLQYYVNNKFKGRWEIYGCRNDKSDPNAFETGLNIMMGIRDPIGREELVALTVPNFGETPQKKRKV